VPPAGDEILNAINDYLLSSQIAVRTPAVRYCAAVESFVLGFVILGNCITRKSLQGGCQCKHVTSTLEACTHASGHTTDSHQRHPPQRFHPSQKRLKGIQTKQTMKLARPILFVFVLLAILVVLTSAQRGVSHYAYTEGCRKCDGWE